MKSKLKKILCVLLALTMAVAVFVSCGKKDAETEPPETEETQADTVPEEEEDIYKEKFYFYDAESGAYCSMKLTDTEAYLDYAEASGEFVVEHVCAQCPYYVDDDGNYVLELDYYYFEYDVLGISVGCVGYENEGAPLVFRKGMGNNMYYAEDILAFVKLGESAEKFICFDGESRGYISQNHKFSDELEFLYVDGGTGEIELVTVSIDDVEIPDTSVVGDAVMKVNYDGKLHEVVCCIYSEDDALEDDWLEAKYSSMCMNYDKSYVARGTTYEEFFEGYTGEDPLFYYRKRDENGKYVEVAVTDYSVEGWDTTSVQSGEPMFYRVTYENDGVIYYHADMVYVLDENDLAKGTIDSNSLNIGVRESSRLFFVAKGTELNDVTADVYPYVGEKITGAAITLSGYDANTVGAQLVTLTSDSVVGEYKLVIYVYEPTEPVLVRVDLPEEVEFNDDGIDFDRSKLIFCYSDGSTKECIMSDCADLIKYSFNPHNGSSGTYDLSVKPVKTIVGGQEYYIISHVTRSYFKH